mmetsp:Transcript_88166/g.190836  ORF Transcript_88166/g.190836 Transcript_88166/m.190836 type:complete len:223 (-) Transcript_88166:49-717(-)
MDVNEAAEIFDLLGGVEGDRSEGRVTRHARGMDARPVRLRSGSGAAAAGRVKIRGPSKQLVAHDCKRSRVRLVIHVLNLHQSHDGSRIDFVRSQVVQANGLNQINEVSFIREAGHVFNGVRIRLLQALDVLLFQLDDKGLQVSNDCEHIWILRNGVFLLLLDLHKVGTLARHDIDDINQRSKLIQRVLVAIQYLDDTGDAAVSSSPSLKIEVCIDGSVGGVV